jgi:hypothetical protein
MSQTLAALKIPRGVLTWSEATAAWVQVVMPPWARRISVSPQSNAIKVVVSTNSAIADGDAYVSDVVDNCETVAADSKYSVPLTAGRGNSPQCSVFIYASVNPTVIELAVEESEVG